MLALFLIIMNTWAAPLEGGYADALVHARSPLEIERLARDYSRLKIAQTACTLELREHIVPVNCYEAVALEMPGVSPEKTERLAHLDDLCARAANGLNDAPSSPFVSKTCAKRLAEAQAIRKYREDKESAWSKY